MRPNLKINKLIYCGVILFVALNILAFGIQNLLAIFQIELHTSHIINLTLLIPLGCILLASTVTSHFIVTWLKLDQSILSLAKIALISTIFNYLLNVIKNIILLKAFDDYVLEKLLNMLYLHAIIFFTTLLFLIVIVKFFRAYESPYVLPFFMIISLIPFLILLALQHWKWIIGITVPILGMIIKIINDDKWDKKNHELEKSKMDKEKYEKDLNKAEIIIQGGNGISIAEYFYKVWDECGFDHAKKLWDDAVSTLPEIGPLSGYANHDVRSFLGFILKNQKANPKHQEFMNKLDKKLNC